MKKLICVLLALCVALALGGTMAEGGRQTASAVLDREGNAVIVTVDLTGGWSVEFASGAVYLYEGEVTEDRQADAIGMTLDREVYEEYLAEAEKSDSCRKVENGVCYAAEDYTYYLVAVDSSACFMVDVPGGVEDDSIFERFALVNQQEYHEALAKELEAQASDDPVAAYEGTWVAGRAVLTIEELDDTVYCTVRWGNSASDSMVWEYQCLYDGISGLSSFENGVKYDETYGEDGEVIATEVLFEDGAASFKLNEDGTLTWTDFKETPGENEVVFEKAE